MCVFIRCSDVPLVLSFHFLRANGRYTPSTNCWTVTECRCCPEVRLSGAMILSNSFLASLLLKSFVHSPRTTDFLVPCSRQRPIQTEPPARCFFCTQPF